MTEYAWRCGIATFGRIARTSAVAHLVAEDGRRTLCGVELRASRPEPTDARLIRCQRCIDARRR